jgi:hypothetical protein
MGSAARLSAGLADSLPHRPFAQRLMDEALDDPLCEPREILPEVATPVVHRPRPDTSDCRCNCSIAGQRIVADLYQLDVTAFPRVSALAQRCFELPAFADAHPFRQPGYRHSSH